MISTTSIIGTLLAVLGVTGVAVLTGNVPSVSSLPLSETQGFVLLMVCVGLIVGGLIVALAGVLG